MSTTATQNVKPKRTIGQKIKRFLKITLAIIGGFFLSIVALGIYLAQSEAAEKARAAAILSIDPMGKMSPEQQEKALVEKKAADAIARKAADEKLVAERKVQAEQEEAAGEAAREQEKKAREAARAAREAEEARIKAEGTPLENAELIFHGWKIGGFGSIFLGDFSIKNKGAYPIKDFDIRCTYFGPSGTELGTVREAAYELVKPKSTLRLKELNMGFMHSQARRTNCEIRSVKRAD
jgi:hypothetical protein